MTAFKGTRRPKAQQVDVVKFWRLLELFSPQQVEQPDPGNADRPVVDWSRGRPLPWDVYATPQPSRGKPRVWQHVVYLGVYNLEAVYEHLHRVFPGGRRRADDGGQRGAVLGVVGPRPHRRPGRRRPGLVHRL